MQAIAATDYGRLMVKGTLFEEFLDMKELTHFHAKITYIGEQRKALPTLVFRSSAVDQPEPRITAAPILSMRVAGIDFANDDLAPIFCSATSHQLASLIEALAMLPTVVNAASATRYDGTYYGKYLSLALYNRIGDRECRLQTVLGQPDAIPLLDAFGRALRDNDECRNALFILWRGLGFHIGVLDPDLDGDGASDGREASWGADPANPDSRGDGIPDGEAILHGLDPLNPFREHVPRPHTSIAEGNFAGSRVVEMTTAPDLRSGQATVELQFTPEHYFPPTDNLVFLQVFRRVATKADGFEVPLLPSLYIEYAGSPELDPLTVDGATVDHKVGELDPYYNGRDPQDQFNGAPDKQHAGFIRDGGVEPTAMIYRCRTYEEHWRALNPEGVREVRFDYEAAVFCENGDAQGNFLGALKWSWGKTRGGRVRAWLRSSAFETIPPNGQVIVESDGVSRPLAVRLADSEGQPSRFYFQVLASWIRNHKFAWPGPKIAAGENVELVVPSPVTVNARIRVAPANALPSAVLEDMHGLRLSGFSRHIGGFDLAANPFPADYFPFLLPLTVSIHYSDDDVAGMDKRTLAVVRYDRVRNRYTSEDLYVLRKNAETNSIDFCTSRFGTFAIAGK